MALKEKLNEKEYAFLMRRAKHSDETLAVSAKKIGITPCYARKISERLRKKIDYVLGIKK